MREIFNGIFYVMRAGCPWRLLPIDLPPWGTIYHWFAVWRDDGRFERINHALVMADRERSGDRPVGPCMLVEMSLRDGHVCCVIVRGTASAGGRPPSRAALQFKTGFLLQ